MKNVLLLPLFCSVSWLSGIVALTIPAPAHAVNIAQSICEYVAADDKKRMRSFLRTNKIKIRNIFKDIECNNQNLLEFAATRGSVKTGELMISKLPKHIVKANIPKIQANQALVDKAKERIN